MANEFKWTRVGKYVIFTANGVTEVYDEPALRKVIQKYLSQESLDRFADDGRFMDRRMFFDGLQNLMDGFELFYPKRN